MSTSDHHDSDGDDDIESQELFESFMEITKDIDNHESEANGAAPLNESTAKDTVDGENEKGSKKEPSSSNTSNATAECASTTVPEGVNVTKRLSKAVGELSDLERQLSMMISTGNCTSPTQKLDGSLTDNDMTVIIDANEDVTVTDKDSTVDEKDGNVASSKEPQFDHQEKLASGGDQDDSGRDNSKTSEIQPTVDHGVKIDVNVENNFPCISDNNTLTSNDSFTNINHDVFKSDTSDNENNTKSENISSSLEKQISLSEVDSESKDTPSSVEMDGSDKQSHINENISKESNEINQCNNDIERGVQGDSTQSTQVSSSAGKSEAVLEKSPESSETSMSVENKLETQDVEDKHNEADDSSTPDIEILMTDESGISENKSLESLDTEIESDMGPDSPALSDEGIDSDARSLDDLDDDEDDDDAFNGGLSTDLANHENLLKVDRNRMGSNSSTVSEREFRKSTKGKHKTQEEAKVHIKGYLLKLGGSGLTPKNWRKRWFVLKEDNCLYYYKHCKDKVPCGVIVLCDYSITKAPDSSKQYCFKLNKGGARSYHFCAASDDNMRGWMVALMKAASAVSAKGTSFQILEGNVHNVSIPALSIKDPECHGYLSKRGLNIKKWKRRYCVLKNGYLYYYSDMSNTTALGVAKLLGYDVTCVESRAKHFCFDCTPPDESMRVFHFSAENENDRERWVERMAESIKRGDTSQ